jgi:hypothetical protein
MPLFVYDVSTRLFFNNCAHFGGEQVPPNIFISWSKERAKAAAAALHAWLPNVIQSTRPWMSDKDIDKGTVWLDELKEALSSLKHGIFCLTPENVNEAWLLYEAGVISKTLDKKARVWTSGNHAIILLGALPLVVHLETIGDTYIAGSLTTDDWKAFSASLVPGGERAIWQKAVEDYFHTRLALRYLNPIKVLQDNGTFQGEGFSIAAIQCSIVEFLESAVQDKSYRLVRKGASPLGPHEYSSSSDIFVSFLIKREPFKNDFNEDQARDFYEGVRCGPVHEARTKNGWEAANCF